MVLCVLGPVSGWSSESDPDPEGLAETGPSFLPAGARNSTNVGFARDVYISNSGYYVVVLEGLLPGKPPQVFWGNDEHLYQLETEVAEDQSEIRFFDRRAASFWGHLYPSDNRLTVHDGSALSQKMQRLTDKDARRFEAKIWSRRVELSYLPPYLRSESLYGFRGSSDLFYVFAYRVNDKDYARVYLGNIVDEQIQWRMVQVLRLFPNGQAVIVKDYSKEVVGGLGLGDETTGLGNSFGALVNVDARTITEATEVAIQSGRTLVPFSYVDLLKLIATEALPKPTVQRRLIVRDLPTPLDLVFKRGRNCQLILESEGITPTRTRFN